MHKTIKAQLSSWAVILVCSVLLLIIISIAGTQFIHLRLQLLLRTTTPYQTKTMGVQVAMIEAVAQINSLMSVRGNDALAKQKSVVEDSLNVYRKGELGLAALSGKDENVSQQLKGIFDKSVAITQKRLISEKANNDSRQTVMQALARIEEQLNILNINTNRQQSSFSNAFNEAYNKASSLVVLQRDYEAIKSATDQLCVILSGIRNLPNRQQVLIARSKGNSFVNAVLKSPLLSTLNGADEQANALKKKLKMVTDIRLALYETPDADKEGQMVQLLSEMIEQHVVAIQGAINGKLPFVSAEATDARNKQDKSLDLYKEASTVMMTTNQLGTLAKILGGLTVQIFSASSVEELQDIQEQIIANQGQFDVSRKRMAGQLGRFHDSASIEVFKTIVTLMQDILAKLLLSNGILAERNDQFGIEKSVHELQTDMVIKTQKLANQGRRNIIQSEKAQERSVQGISFLVRSTILVNAIVGVIILITFAWIGRRMLAFVIKPLEKMVDSVTDIEQTSDFSKRVESNPDDEVGKIGVAFNLLIESNQKAITDINRVMVKAALGDFSDQIVVELKGDLNLLKNNINQALTKLKISMDGLGTVMSALTEGNFSVRMSDNIDGAFKQIVDHAMVSMESVINNINEIMMMMAKNDLSQRVNVAASGKLGMLKDNINASLMTLSKTIYDIDTGAVELAVSASQTSTSVQQVKERSIDQLQNIESIVTAINQTTQAIVEVTRSTEKASLTAVETDATIEKSKEYLDRLRIVMNGIAENSKKVNAITAVISDIASQTNLLALNAAIEAARAGDSGKGFAVVADEVRKLAGHSANSANEINLLLTNAMNEVEEGISVFDEVNNGMIQVKRSASVANDQQRDIATAMEQTSASMLEINSNVRLLRALGEANVLSANEMNATVSRLSDIAETTKTRLGEFKLS